jgi:hypothetical protein
LDAIIIIKIKEKLFYLQTLKLLNVNQNIKKNKIASNRLNALIKSYQKSSKNIKLLKNKKLILYFLRMLILTINLK